MVTACEGVCVCACVYEVENREVCLVEFPLLKALHLVLIVSLLACVLFL